MVRCLVNEMLNMLTRYDLLALGKLLLDEPYRTRKYINLSFNSNRKFINHSKSIVNVTS